MSHLGFSLDQGVAGIGAILLVSLVARHAALMCSLRAPGPYIGHGPAQPQRSAEDVLIQATHHSFMATPVTEESVRELERDIWVIITHFDRRQIA